MPQLSLVTANHLAQLSRQGGLIAAAVLLAHSPLSPAEIGNWELLQYLGYLLSFAWITGLAQALLAMFATQDERAQRELIVAAPVVFLLIGTAVLGLLLLGRSWLLPALTAQPKVDFLTLYALYLWASWPALLQEHFYNLQQRPRALAFYALLTNGLFLLLLTAPPLLGWSFRWSFTGLVAMGLARLAWLAWFCLKHGHWRWNVPLVGRWLRLGGPLVLYALLGALSMSFDPWFVAQWYAGDEQTFAIFRYGSRELPLVTALATGVTNALLPRLQAGGRSALAELRHESRRLMHLLLPLSILLLLTSRYWFPVVFTPAFAPAVPLFNTLLLISLNRMVFANAVLIGNGQGRVLPFTVLVSLIGNVGFSWWLVHDYGLLGIVWGTVIAFTLEKVVAVIYLRAWLGIRLEEYADTRWLAGYGVLLGLAYWWSMA